jgi:cell division septation protein DedD
MRSLAAESIFSTAPALPKCGLALALAGDPQAAVLALEQAVRDGEATPKMRQNLALSYALAGRWLDARAMATRDLPADLADKRIVEWASLARPSNSWEQVATILGVARKSDDGQPTALALVDYPEQKYAEAAPVIQAPLPAVETAPQPNYEVSPEVKDPAPVRFAAVPEAPVIAAPAEPIKQQVVAISAPASKVAKAPAPVESGRFVVQLGAFKSAGVAANGWTQVSKRWGFLNEYDARQAKVKLPKGTFYRLSVSGFETRSAANEVCSKIKAEGGQCFIRSILPTDGVRWAAQGSKKGQQLASR